VPEIQRQFPGEFTLSKFSANPTYLRSRTSVALRDGVTVKRPERQLTQFL